MKKKFGTVVFLLFTLGLLVFVSIIVFTVVGDIKKTPDRKEQNNLVYRNCRTLYPVVIAHHWGPPRHRVKNEKGTITEHFYRPVISVLKHCGADVRVVKYSHDYDTTPNRAKELKDFIVRHYYGNSGYMVKWKTAHPGRSLKINLVGHSQGCQDSRYMISNLNMAHATASWTGLAGESQGTPMADLGIAVYDNPLCNLFADRLLMMLFPDSCPDSDHVFRFIESVRCLTENYMQGTGDHGTGGKLEGQKFFAPYSPLVYYQDWAAKLKWMPEEWKELYLLWKFIQMTRGDNDIYTPVVSQIHKSRYVKNRGVLDGEEWCGGVHHMAFTGTLNQPNPGFNQEQFWIDLVAGLREMGF